MAKPRKVLRGVLEGGAYQLAFQIGRSLERAIVARAIQLAVRDADASAEVIVTAEQVRCALDESLLAEACSQIGIVFDGKTKKGRWKSPAA